MNLNTKFATVLRELRSEKGFTQEQLAELSDIDYKHLQKLEGRSPSSPTLDTLEKIANGLDIKISDIIKRIECMK